MIAFFAPCIPPATTFQAKELKAYRSKGGRLRASLRKSDEVLEAIAEIDSALRPFAPDKPLSGPLILHLEFDFPFPKGTSKVRREKGRQIKATKPDCSNLGKTTEDRLVELGFLEGDELVVDFSVRKWFSHHPGIYVRIEEVDIDQEVNE